MTDDLETGANAVHSLHDHLVLTTYRREMVTPERADFIRDVITGFTDNYGVELTGFEGEDDHVHLQFRTEPTTDLVKFVNTVKGATARRIRNEYEEELKTELFAGSFWNQSYCLVTSGQVSPETLTRYVEEQRTD